MGIEKRLPDFSKYVDPQKANADVILRYEPSDKGLPYLKVKLIQKKDGAFPMIRLKKEIEENMEGLNAKSAGEFTEAMVKLKSSPGSQNGTGMLQTVIAMKVREIYEKLGLQTA